MEKYDNTTDYACWVAKAIDEILVTFPLQQCLCASLLSFMFTACLLGIAISDSEDQSQDMPYRSTKRNVPYSQELVESSTRPRVVFLEDILQDRWSPSRELKRAPFEYQ